MLSRVFLVVILLLTLNGCGSLFGREGYFRDRGDDYLQAREIPPIKVPEGLDTSAISELFVVPPASSDYVDPDREFEVPRAQSVAKGDKAEVKIQKLGAKRWIVVNSSPGVVWPRVKAFLDANSIGVFSEDSLRGEIESVWLKLADEPETKDRYLIKVKQGLHNNTSEVTVTQITVDANVPGAGKVNWPENSVNAEREKWLLDRLAGDLASEKDASVSLLAQSIGGNKRVEFVRPYKGEPFILMDVDYERAWASVGGALNREGFELVSENRKEGYLTATFNPDFDPNEEIEEPGMLSKAFGLDKKEKRKAEESKVTYQIRLYQFNQKEVRVFCRDESGVIPDVQEAEKILYKVRVNLI